MMNAAPIVFVIDDDPSVRKALGRLLKSAGFPVEVFATAEEFLQQPLPDVPACMILDVRMPGLSGLDLQRTLAERNVSLPIVFLTGHGDIPMTVRAMKAGAVDFLPKPVHVQDLLAAVRQAIARHAQVRQAETEVAEIRRRVTLLSPREREVMALIVQGMLNKQAGHRLGVTEKTIKVHRAQVMRKMQVDSLAELVRLAQRIGVPSAPSPPLSPSSAVASVLDPSCIG
jgi:FixJ family two-component response regulator